MKKERDDSRLLSLKITRIMKIMYGAQNEAYKTIY